MGLAEELGVLGLDARAPFLRDAQRLALEREVARRGRFEQADTRNRHRQDEPFDVALLLSVGPAMGDHEQTIAWARRSVVRAAAW